jgi:hypothetical protein
VVRGFYDAMLTTGSSWMLVEQGSFGQTDTEGLGRQQRLRKRQMGREAPATNGCLGRCGVTNLERPLRARDTGA